MQKKIYLVSGLLIGLATGFAARDLLDKKNNQAFSAESQSSLAEQSEGNTSVSQANAQQKEIARLTLEIASLQSQLKQATLPDSPRVAPTSDSSKDKKPSEVSSDKAPETNNSETLQTLTMDELQDRFMAEMLASLKHVVIKLNDEQARSYERGFANNTGTNDWGQAYEARISRYLREADPNGLHFVNQLRCTHRMCKLSVTTGDPGNWNQVLTGMLNTKWYNTVGFINQSASSPELVYYFERTDNRR